MTNHFILFLIGDSRVIRVTFLVTENITKKINHGFAGVAVIVSNPFLSQ